MSKFSNQLSDAQVERLAILAEELGEAQQVIGKILRHGYESRNPLRDFDDTTNRQHLERECGDILLALEMLCVADDIKSSALVRRQEAKREFIKRWLHHQEPRR
jgi:NTP pyrophosphatase (non-canonical NTP hydrolase)